MGSSVSPVFTTSHAYNWSFTKEDIDECAENQALWGPVVAFGPYGPWILSFYPNGYLSSTPAKFAVILKAAHRKPSRVPSCLVQAQLTLIGDDKNENITIKFSKSHIQINKLNPCIGCAWYQKSLYERFPEIQNWNKFHFNIVCYFTSIEVNLADDRNWLTFDFLISHDVPRAADYFVALDLENHKLESQNTDCTVVFYNKKWFSKKLEKVELPMHKSKLIPQSPIFVKHFEDHPDTPLDFAGFPGKIIEDMIIFCYKGELDSFDESHVEFAAQFEMNNLLQKADEYLSMKAKNSNVKKMMELTEKFILPELTKQCCYLIEVSSYKKKETFKDRFASIMRCIGSFLRMLFSFDKKQV